MRIRLFFVLTVTLFCLSLPMAVTASPPSVSEDVQYCLGCHGNKDFSLDLQKNEKLPLFIDVNAFAGSVHGSLACSLCHKGFSAEKHPTRVLKTRRDYTVSGSGLCKTCHTSFKSALHAKMSEMAKKGGKVCVDCHGAHSIQRVQKGMAKDSGYCLACHNNALAMSFRDGEQQSLKIDTEALGLSVHDKLYCSDCHFGFSTEEHPERTFKSKRDYVIAASESCRRCHFDKYTKTLESIHYAMLSQGNLNAPVCVDCHGAHSIAPVGKGRAASAKRCEKCHAAIYGIYATSVHGSALFNENNQDVPVCVDCHRAHNIEDPRTFDYREKVPQMCGNCHANKTLMDKYGLSTAVLKSYLQDFHGVTLKLYRKQKDFGDKTTMKPIAVCIDCHGIHDITATTGPKSSIVKANLIRRCQKCHPNATENFPDSWISHYEPSMKKAPLVYFINLVYKIFIPFMMVGLILQILLHIWRYTVNRQEVVSMKDSGLIVDGKFRRFSIFRIMEHQLNMTAFAILVITGLSQKYYTYNFSQWIIINLGGIDAVRLIHRYTGLCFAFLTITHVAMASVGVIFRKWPASMVINRKDFTDAIENIRYYFGITDQPARCDRYDYKQKFEYWGVVVGGLLMIATGLVLWFPTNVVRYLPGEFIPAAKAAHSNEALLAFLVIVVWHLYNAIFSPEVFPLDTSIFTGKISVARMKHEHPLEYERITGESLGHGGAMDTEASKEETG